MKSFATENTESTEEDLEILTTDFTDLSHFKKQKSKCKMTKQNANMDRGAGTLRKT
jgi:hypothetical protein